MNAQMLQQLFGGMQRQQQGTPPIAEFKAGLMKIDGEHLVTADPRKGKVTVEMGADGVLHFKWSVRSSSQPEHDLMIFPGDATFQKITEVEDGRVFILKMISANTKHIYWMQEPKDDKDDEICKKISDAIKSASSGSAGLSNLGIDQNAAAEMGLSQQQLYEMMTGSSGPAPGSSQNRRNDRDDASGSGGAASGGSGSSEGAGSGDNSGSGSGSSGSGSGSGSSGQNESSGSDSTQQQQQQPDNQATDQLAKAMLEALANMNQSNNTLQENIQTHRLEDILRADDVSQLIVKLPESDQQHLLEFLPEGQQSQAHLTGHLRSAQFRQAVKRLEKVLNGGSMGALMTQLDLPTEDATIGVASFLSSLQKAADSQNMDVSE